MVIFVRDKRRCATLNKILQENKFPAIELHSDMNVEDRFASLYPFMSQTDSLLLMVRASYDEPATRSKRPRVHLALSRDSPLSGACWPHNFLAEVYRENGISSF